MKKLNEPEALHKAASYCTTCERCISEVKSKLTSWGVEAIIQQRIIERLIDEKFIDEKRYCQAFVNDKLRFNRWGRIKITAALREKRIPKELINEALEHIDEEEYSKALLLLIESKRKEIKNADEYTEKQKLLRFAASRGFETELIMQAIKFTPDEMDF